MVVATCRDATDQLIRADAQARLADIVSSSQDAIISKDLNGIIRTWNDAACRIFGYSTAEAVGRPIHMLIPPNLVDEETEILARIRNGEGVAPYDTVRVRKDGGLIDISLTVSPIFGPDGAVLGASKIARDITERRRHEAVIRDSEGRKDEFLATLAHELRNPLAPLRMGLTLLKRQSAAGMSTEQTQAMMDRQLVQMTRLIEDLMDVSRISTGRLELRKESVSLVSILNMAIETTRPSIQSGHHELTVKLPAESLRVVADPTRLSQVCVNLLGNAAKAVHLGTLAA